MFNRKTIPLALALLAVALPVGALAQSEPEEPNAESIIEAVRADYNSLKATPPPDAKEVREFSKPGPRDETRSPR